MQVYLKSEGIDDTYFSWWAIEQVYCRSYTDLSSNFRSLLNNLVPTNRYSNYSEHSVEEQQTHQPQGQGGVVVDNSWQATKHYLFRDGSPARIGPNTTNSLLSSPEFLTAHRKIINGQEKPSGNFPVDMTKRVFHIGRTNVSYSIAPGGNSVTYKLYDGDGFWDPDFIDEKYLGPSSPYFRPDKMGPNLERFGGTPYYYIPTIITIPF